MRSIVNSVRCGGIHDNSAILLIAIANINDGDTQYGRNLLIKLKKHIEKTKDAKSEHWLLPQIEKALAKTESV